MNKVTPTKPSYFSQRRYVPIKDAADYLGVSPRTVRRMIDNGDIPAYRVGGRSIRVVMDDIEDKAVKRI